jgi:hypothetical protein
VRENRRLPPTSFIACNRIERNELKDKFNPS